MSKPFIPITTNFSELDCQKAFNALQQQQSLYAYNFAKASWNGAKICFFERSYESPAIIYLVLKAFEQGAKQTVQALKDKFDELAVKQLLIYISAVIDNTGNYKSFGDTKFIPQCSEQFFKNFFLATPYWSTHQLQFLKIYSRISKLIFDAETPRGLIAFSDKNGTSGYYSSNVSSADAEKIKDILIAKGIKSQNNRLLKQSNSKYIVKVAAVQPKEEQIVQNGITIKVVYGEFAPFLKLTNHYLAEAQKHSANQIQSKMIGQYIQHFKTGEMENHLESQRLWIQDKGPLIQTNIGFIESYLDPLKIRAEFQGFVAVVNQQESKLLSKLVQGAQTTLKYLPWGPAFEVEHFKKPDFTSLDVLAFASSGIPVGINIPNYNQIRQHLGFKNVNLGNAYGKPTKESLQYVPENQKELHLKYNNPALFVIVALHELLGHGSGRQYSQLPTIISPLDGKPFTTFYHPNQTWHSVFGEIASTYEECRADSVALFLSVFEDVQQTLLPQYTKEQRAEIVYISWYDLVMGGVKGLIYYDIQHKKWLQAHVGASFAILSVLREEGGIVQIKEIERNGEPYLEVVVHKQAILTKGKQAIGRFLKHLQIYRSTADFEQGNKFFQKYLQVDQQLLKYREIVLKNKRPRGLTVQPDVKLNGDKVQYIKYENSAFGQIDSALAHYSQNVDDIISEWENNNQEFVY